MNRFLTLASSSLFATGLAILPVSVFAQPNATPGNDAKAGTPTAQVTGHDTKATIAAAPVKPAAHDAKVVTAPVTGKDAGKANSTKVTTAPVTPAPSGGAAKTGNHAS